MAVIPDDIKDISKDKLPESVKTIKDYIVYLREQIEFWASNRNKEITSAITSAADARAEAEEAKESAESAQESADDALANQYFKSGDSYPGIEQDYIICPGYISNSGKDVFFSITLPKSVKNIESITVTPRSGGGVNLRGVGGYVGSSGYQDMDAADITKTIFVEGEFNIIIRLRKSAAWTNATNNTPVTAAFAANLHFN